MTLFALFYGRQDKIATDRKSTTAIKSATADKSTTDHKNTIDHKRISSLTTANAFTILLCRIVLGAVFTGRLVAFAYSITGGLLGFAAQILMKRFVSNKQIWVCGAVGAVLHNIGQILAAMIITGTPEIAAYLPVLIIAGVFTGVITGLIAQFTLARLQKRTT